ncbi:MAG: alpha/beta fold hydrolase [Lachnospiraceae bacterium]|nr:alpha/beta fold hydrolase [Lachnospiraceae bacterium]
MRGENVNNPVIIYLHGGPSSPDGYVTYGFTDYLVDDYTVIAWDQRGCGRTYIHNRNVDVNNDTASFEQALVDLDELVDYARERFHQDKVIILGHSYGTILGSVYARTRPEKVDAYIGAAQVISLEETDRQRMERERERANLLRAISHDLRTPLSGIMGSAEMLMDMTEKDDNRQKLLKGIYEDADWLKSLVENILSLTRLQDGKILVHKEMEALEEVIACAVAHIEKIILTGRYKSRYRKISKWFLWMQN